MHCRACGKQIADQAVICPTCGVSPFSSTRFCQTCGAETHPQAEICVKCGVRLVYTGSGAGSELKSRLAAGLLGIFLGAWGVHRFYLGFVGIGIAQIIVTFVTCGAGALWGLIEGILLLTGSMNRDAQGRPLKD